jgi:hypothetical protein
MLPQRGQSLCPPPTTKQISQDPKSQRHENPAIFETSMKHLTYTLKIEVAIGPKQNNHPQQKRENYLQDLFQQLFYITSFQNQ